MSRDQHPTPTQRILFGVIAALCATSVLYRLLVLHRLEHSALLFIGIPAALAYLTVAAARPKTATGLVCRVITIALLMSAILFGEGFVCILFAAPLFYLVGIIIGKTYEFAHRNMDKSNLPTLVLIGFLPMSLEGVLPGFAFPREAEVTVTRTVDAAAAEVRAALAGTPRFARELPPFLKLGFPTPGATDGAGLEPGDRRVVRFEHGQHHPGALVLEVARSEPGRVTFAAVSDDSYITHWLSWRAAEVRWTEVAPGRTRVSWTLRYGRRLDPAWYFAPLEHYGVRVAAGYLIETLATPRPAR